MHCISSYTRSLWRPCITAMAPYEYANKTMGYLQSGSESKVTNKSKPPVYIKPLRAKFCRGNINIYSYFMSLLHIDMAQVPKIERSQGISSHDIDLVEPR